MEFHHAPMPHRDESAQAFFTRDYSGVMDAARILGGEDILGSLSSVSLDAAAAARRRPRQAQPAQAQPRSRSTMAQVAGAKRAQERPAQAARHVGWSSGSAVAAAASARSIVVIAIVVWLPLVSWRAQQGTASKAGLARCRPGFPDSIHASGRRLEYAPDIACCTPLCTGFPALFFCPDFFQ